MKRTRTKAWKLSTADWETYEKYDDYVEAYEEALERCSTDDAPWYIVPSNQKWFRNLAVAQTIAEHLTPFERVWKKELESRGRTALAELAIRRRARLPRGGKKS